MFTNGKRYQQAIVPTPTGYLINPNNRDYLIRANKADTTFITDGWFNKQSLPKAENNSETDFKRALFAAVKTSPVYVWAGDESSVGFEFLAPYSQVEETDNHYIEANEHTTYDPALDQWINYHWNRLSMMKGKQGTIYVFPHSLVYWVCIGKYAVSPGLRHAIIKGEHISGYDLLETPYKLDQDPCNLIKVWDETEDQDKKSKEAETEPFNMDMPKQYQGDYPKQFINADSWVNFTSSYEDGEYQGQTFYLPSPVDEQNLKALLGRQHAKHVALHYMAQGFGQISEACKVAPELRKQLIVLFLNYRKHQKFAAHVNKTEGQYDHNKQKTIINFPEKLKGLAPVYFPFTQ